MKNKKVKLFHGTSEESYNSILANGFNPRLASVNTWGCSESDYIYFYNPLNFIEEGESDDIESAYNTCVERCFENAQISASIQKSHASFIYVMELEVNLKDVESDDSCDNMDLASKVNTDKLNVNMIKKVYRADFAYNMSLVYIAGLKYSDYLNLDDFTDFELNMMDKINQSNLFINECGIEWEEVENFKV